MVCGLAWRCCIKRWVKKHCKSGAKVVGVIMADPPSDARAGAWLLASAPESCLNTIACPRRGHDRGRRTRSAGGVLDLGWTDTTLPACWLRIGVSYADVGITDSMPAAGLCRLSRDGSSIPSVWRCVPHFSDI